VHIPSAISGRGQHGGAPKNHTSVLNRPGFKFNETRESKVGITANSHTLDNI
jgi:hypothetical protein